MKSNLFRLMAALGFCWPVFGEVVLYRETFPYPGPSGNLPISACGWSNAIPNNANRLYQVSGTNGAVFAFQADADVPITTAFLTTASLDNGATGMAFPIFNPAQFVGLALSADIQPGFQPDSVFARIAVQMNGSNWYARAAVLPVPTVTGGFATYTQAFTPAASAWINASIRSTNVFLGTPATTDLSGLITGAGLFFTHTAHAGTYNFNNFLITAAVGSLTVNSVSNGMLNLAWSGANSIVLQSNTNLAIGPWQDETDTLGQSSTAVPLGESQKFFRLKLQGGAGTSSNLANLGFEADGTNTATPQGWTVTGNAAAVTVNSNDAYAGSFSLLQSNVTAYQAQASVLITNLANGFYQLNAWVKNSGGQSACYLSANDRLTSLPPLYTNWTPMVVRGISVTNGQCLIGIYSDAAAGNWCRVDALALTNDNISYNFLKGGDVSELPRLEYYGGKFYDNGVQGDCLQIMKNHGCNIVRIRMYNDPGNTNYYPANRLDPLGWQNPARTIALCQRAKTLGLQIQLTFHYSDYWSNPGAQYKPHEWEGLSFTALTNALYGFTRTNLMALTNAGIYPEFVSLGNEIAGGILFPDGANTNAAGWNNLAILLNTGYAAVKSVSPASKVVIHLNNVDASNVNYFFGNLKSRNVSYDVIGCSYYPFWTGLTTEQVRTNINSWYANYNKPVLIMETGYNWATNTCNGFPGQLSGNGPEFFPSTPAGQKNFLLKCFNDLKLVNNGNCIGDLYWDPVFICVPGQGWESGAQNVVGNTTLFDFTGHTLPSLDAFLYNN
jgi:arabinogalactan endo-1,4-beta-galactosidase